MNQKQTPSQPNNSDSELPKPSALSEFKQKVEKTLNDTPDPYGPPGQMPLIEIDHVEEPKRVDLDAVASQIAANVDTQAHQEYIDKVYEQKNKLPRPEGRIVLNYNPPDTPLVDPSYEQKPSKSPNMNEIGKKGVADAQRIFREAREAAEKIIKSTEDPTQTN